MQNLRLIFVLLMLIFSSGPAYVFSADTQSAFEDTDTGSLISEDFQDLSPSRISTSISFLPEQTFTGSHTIFSEENCRAYSRDKAYLSSSLLIEPGLSPPDIIFPFHTFL